LSPYEALWGLMKFFLMLSLRWWQNRWLWEWWEKN
jgi:hypothetical protein